MSLTPKGSRPTALPSGLRGGNLNLAAPKAGSDPFKKLSLCASDCDRGAIQSGQGPDAPSFAESIKKPLAPSRKQWQTVKIGRSAQNQIGRIAFDDDPRLVSFGTKLV
jgi:hypothetical protein